MLRRLIPLFKGHIFIFILLAVLVVASSVTNGRLSVITSVCAGALMIYAALAFTVWIIRTPAKKSKEEVA